MLTELVLIGGGGHARSVADSIESMGLYHIVGYTDIEPSGLGYEYLGSDEALGSLFGAGVSHAACGIGYLGHGQLRENIYARLKSIGFILPAIIDSSASVSVNAVIGEGTFIGKNSSVNSGSHIGIMSIINTGSIIEHDNFIGDYVHVSVGSVVCGNVTIGRGAFIGANSTIIQGVTIGMNTIIGASSLVLGDVGDNQKEYGLIRGKNTRRGGGARIS